MVEPGAEVSVVAPPDNAEPHTVTAVEREQFDVQALQPGETRSFRAPTEPGEYPFYCVYHGDAQGNGMAGVLVVQTAPAGPPPSVPPSPTPGTPAEEEVPAPAPALVALALLAAARLTRRGGG